MTILIPGYFYPNKWIVWITRNTTLIFGLFLPFVFYIEMIRNSLFAVLSLHTSTYKNTPLCNMHNNIHACLKEVKNHCLDFVPLKMLHQYRDMHHIFNLKQHHQFLTFRISVEKHCSNNQHHYTNNDHNCSNYYSSNSSDVFIVFWFICRGIYVNKMSYTYLNSWLHKY